MLLASWEQKTQCADHLLPLQSDSWWEVLQPFTQQIGVKILICSFPLFLAVTKRLGEVVPYYENANVQTLVEHMSASLEGCLECVQCYHDAQV